jgi:hypothetical protein
MRLPTLVIASFSHSCRADMDDIEKFLTRYRSEDLVAGTRLAERLERLRMTLWQQWCRMDAAWQNHNPSDGNVGTEILAGLEKIVEATRVAVDDVLQASGRALEVKREAGLPASTTSYHNEPPTTWRQQRISKDAGGGATHTAEVVQVAAVTEASRDGVEAVSDETCGGAAIVAKRVHVDIMNDNTDLLAKEVEYVADEEAESEDLTPAKTVRTHIFEAIEEFHEMEQSGALSPVRRDREGFHGVERPVLTDLLAVRCEYVSLDFVDTDGRTRSRGLFDTWCGNRSIENKICSEVWQCRIEWPMALLENFWLQRRNHVWGRGWGSLLGVYTQQVAGLENFWLFWIWRPGLLCKQHRTLGRNADEGSVAFDMSDTLVDRIEGAKASCEAAFAVVNYEIRELEDHYPGVGGQLKDFKARLE